MRRRMAEIDRRETHIGSSDLAIKLHERAEEYFVAAWEVAYLYEGWSCFIITIKLLYD